MAFECEVVWGLTAGLVAALSYKCVLDCNRGIVRVVAIVFVVDLDHHNMALEAFPLLLTFIFTFIFTLFTDYLC